MTMILTAKIVNAAAMDAGNRSMRKSGRTVWDDSDYAAAVREFERLAPTPEAWMAICENNLEVTK